MEEAKKGDLRPAQLLVGLTLKDEWKVTQLLDRPPSSTGGNFSVGYVVEKGGNKAFLKAFDYRAAFEEEDPAPMLGLLTSAYNFERELLERCANQGMSRIVRTLGSGAIRTKDNDPLYVVQYVIFELAEGDVRTFLSISDKANLAWKFRTLREAATGLAQLHGREVAHQDLKPSNVLVFNEDKTKVADLGCASVKNHASPRDSLVIPGAGTYAAPELLYRYLSPDWEERRISADLYLLGSLVTFFFTGMGTTKLLIKNLEDAHRPEMWRGTFHDVLPFLIDGFEDVLRAVKESTPDPFKDKVVELVRNLCFPDPTERGHPRSRLQVGAKFSLERFISDFNSLSARAEVQLRTSL